MMSRTMESLRQNIVTKQVAGGKEFKGQAFLSKPDEVVFEDFEVEVPYRKRLQLTNVSYTINHCKLISADLLGSILMMAHTGPFTIPVRCLTKKCIIAVESAQVDFGKVCVGETIQHLVTIHNSGAMPTHFQLMPLAQPPAAAQANSASSKDGSIKSSGGPLADRSTASIMSTVELHPTPPSTLLHMTVLTCRSAVELAPHSHSLEPELDKHGPGMELVVPGGGPDHAEQYGDQAVAMATGPMASEGGAEGGAPNSLDVCIKTGKLTDGDIEGFGSINIELVFTPTAIGRYTAEFSLTFSHPSVQQVTMTAQGEGSDLPIFVEQEVMDFHICMVDRPYQDCLAITNRATIAHTVVVNIPEELHTHLQVLPKQAVIAGGSSSYIQLKFRPTHDIFTHCAKYFNTATNILEVVVKVIVEGQTRKSIGIVSDQNQGLIRCVFFAVHISRRAGVGHHWTPLQGVDTAHNGLLNLWISLCFQLQRILTHFCLHQHMHKGCYGFLGGLLNSEVLEQMLELGLQEACGGNFHVIYSLQ